MISLRNYVVGSLVLSSAVTYHAFKTRYVHGG